MYISNPHTGHHPGLHIGQRTALALIGSVIAMLFAASPAWADRDHDHDGGRDRRHLGNEQYFDNRYHHDHYYPPRGYQVPIVPSAAVSVHFGGSNYFYHGGIWYRPFGPRFRVIAPPFGVVVPVLPPFYTTLWVRGIPYYYANDVYYVWRPEERGYVVSAPPKDDEISTQAAASTAALGDQIFIYPKNGQSAEQQSTDRYECHSWANKETGYDPTLPNGNVPAKDAGEKRADYFRAMTACLEGRGYSVK